MWIGETVCWSAFPNVIQALSFRATYSYKDTYLVEGNLGYTGSENFNKERRYGWFPSISGGWVPTQYDWYRNLLPFNNFLKFRASWGRVGNDRLKDENGNDIRFPYLTTLGNVSSTWGIRTCRKSYRINEFKMGSQYKNELWYRCPFL